LIDLQTREELRESLQQELTNFASDADLAASTMADAANLTISWNYREFEVTYPSLADEIKIGDYYLRLLLERDHEATLQASLGEGTAVGSGIKRAYVPQNSLADFIFKFCFYNCNVTDFI
jgi:DNAJ protein RME-8 N-terminal